MSQLTHAKSAFLHLFKLLMLLASFSIMIWLSTALRVGAENFTTVANRATNSIFSHAFSCFSRYWFVIIIPGIHVNISLNDFHDIAAATRNKIWVFSHELGLNNFLNLFIIFVHVIAELPILDLLPASLFRANDIFGLFNLENGSLSKATLVNQVVAIG